MADRASASIVLGGTLSHIHVDDLIAAIGADRLCVDYGDRPLDEKDIISGFPLYGAATGVAGASFYAVEAFCRDHGLHYVRRSDACPGSWDTNMVVFTGDGDVRTFASDDAGTVMLSIDEIRDLGSMSAIYNHVGPAMLDVGPLVIVGSDPPEAAAQAAGGDGDG